MSAFHTTSDHIDKACFAFNSLTNNQRTGSILEYFESIFSSASSMFYLNGSSIVEENMNLGSARREVVTIDGEKVLKVIVTGLENNVPFLYYRSFEDYSYYFRENSRTIIEMNEKELTYRIIENAITSRLT